MRLNLIFSLLLVAPVALADYSQRADARVLIEELVESDNLSRGQLESVLGSASYQQSIIDAISRPAERVLTWGEYRNIFLGDARIEGGVKFWQDNADVLAAAHQEFGVPPEIIIAIIGVEPLYGKFTGSYRVIDALATLAFDYPPRSPFFRSELKHFLIFTAEQGRDPLQFMGSYAGAMGYGQFIPSSYRRYARDYSGDGFADLWQSTEDAVWSVGNYLAEHRWHPGETITLQLGAQPDIDRSILNAGLKPDKDVASLRSSGAVISPQISASTLATVMELENEIGVEFWLGLHNFYVITRYNNSHLYAMAVYQLSEAIRLAKMEADNL
jgi:membrane-bound lytic murein transglycosylase B